MEGREAGDIPCDRLVSELILADGLVDGPVEVEDAVAEAVERDCHGGPSSVIGVGWVACVELRRVS